VVAEVEGARGGNRGLRESHLSYIQEGLCYLLAGTTPIVWARVCECVAAGWGEGYTLYIYIYTFTR